MLRRIRITVQCVALAVFLYLLARTVGVGEDRLGPPVRVFLQLDPLAGLAAFLRTRVWHGLMWLSLVTLALTLVLGRSFCGWICPLGTLGQVSGRLARPRTSERSADRFHRAQKTKIAVLLFVLGGAVSGAQWTGILDPICLLIRGLALGFGPLVEWGVRSAAAALSRTPFAGLTEPVYRLIRDRLLAPHPPHFEQATAMALLLLFVLGLSWVVRRFWCRMICPLGGLLGAVASVGLLRLRQSESRCTGCAVCTFHCQGAADPDVPGGWRASECFVCGNCTSGCHRQGLSFTWVRPAWTKRRKAVGERKELKGGSSSAAPTGPALARRGFFASLGVGLLSGFVARTSPARFRPAGSVIRPPGSGPEDEFLDRCVRCGECMKVCPANGLHPAGLEAGADGLWAPVLRARLGYCEYHCTLCGQVCPTGAIRALTPAEKEKVVIGLAWVDTSRCLPYAANTPCIVCEEHCPTSPKAIVLVATEPKTGGASEPVFRRPTVDLKLCVGCGVCEYVCPLPGRAAIRIEGAGRVRGEAILPTEF